MSSLFTSLLGGNLIANNQASSTASLLGQNAQIAMSQQQQQNGVLSDQEALYNNLYSQIIGQTSQTLGSPVMNAGKLTGLKAIQKTGPMGDTQGVSTARYSLLGN